LQLQLRLARPLNDKLQTTRLAAPAHVKETTAGSQARATMNTSQPTSSAIEGVEFGFLSASDVRALSVKRITNPTTFDSLLHPVTGGLHDAALGAFLDNP
jgi:hypothetical protein